MLLILANPEMMNVVTDYRHNHYELMICAIFYQTI